MKHVWIVFAGEWEGRHVEQVFDNEDAANEHLKSFTTENKAGVERFRLHHVANGKGVYFLVTLFEDGDHWEQREARCPDDLDDLAIGVVQTGETGPPRKKWHQVWVEAATPKAALEIAREKVDQFKAEQAS